MAEALMSPLRGLVESRRDWIRSVAATHRGVRIAVFGSVARGEERPGSDIDFLVEFEPGSSGFDLVRLQNELAEGLGLPVDVVSVGGLLPRDVGIREHAIWL